MKSSLKYIPLVLYLFVGLLLTVHHASALEVQYPNLPVFGTLTQSTNTLPQVFLFLFTLALWGAGIVLLGSVIYVGFQYMASGANPDKRRLALRRFAGVVTGAAMLFGTFLILQTVNPELTSLKNLTFGICNGPGLPSCPQVTGPTLGNPSGGPTPSGPPPIGPPPGGVSGGGAFAGFKYFCQGNTYWGRQPYDGGTLSTAGCGATSLAMVLDSFNIQCNGAECTPDLVANMISSGQVPGVYAASGGTGFSDIGALNQWLSSSGVVVSVENLLTEDPSNRGHYFLDLDRAKNVIDGGGIILGASENGSPNGYPCANCSTSYVERVGHIFVVDSVDPSTSSFEVRDPSSCDVWHGNNNEGTAKFTPQGGVGGSSTFTLGPPTSQFGFYWIMARAVVHK